MKIIVILSLLTISLRGIASRSCFDQLPRQNIDPTQMMGSWYLAVHTGDIITSHNVKCIKIEDFTPAEDGWELTITNFDERTPPKTDRIHFLRTKDTGIYELENTSTEKLVDSQSFDSDGVLSINAKLEDQSMNTVGVGYITDYKNYYIHVSCRSEDQLLVWAMSPRPTVSAHDVIQIVNALHKHGISETLQLGQCDQV